MAHVPEQILGLLPPAVVLARRLQSQIQAVQLLPHVDADLLAHLARVLAGVRHARQQRLLAIAHRQVDGEQRELDEPGALGVQGLQRAQDAHALPRLRLRRAVGSERDADLEQPCGVLGALEIATQPVEVVGDARQHLATLIHSSTHVSLLPPPCDELTTSDPRRSATRVSPPGTMTVCWPARM